MGYPTVTLTAPTDLEDAKIAFMGQSFDALDMDALIAACKRHIRQGNALTYVVTPNVDHMVRLEAEPQYRPLYEAAGYNVCDSRILELLARFDGKTLKAVPGADLVEALIRMHIQPHERIVVIGADADVIMALERDFGFSNIAWHEPPMGMKHNPDAIERAARFVLDHTEGFAFLCVGSPQQEMVAKKAVELGGGKGVALCCGASLDFLSGKTARAPKWMRENRLEWLHRLMSQPGRLWRRYLVDGPRIFKIWMKYREK